MCIGELAETRLLLDSGFEIKSRGADRQTGTWYIAERASVRACASAVREEDGEGDVSIFQSKDASAVGLMAARNFCIGRRVDGERHVCPGPSLKSCRGF